MSFLRAIWIETSPPLRRAWAIMWVAGTVLLFLGIWGDSVNYWDQKPFLVNICSALTGVMFGIPLALIVLQRVTVSETDAAEARAARRLAARVSSDLALASAALIPAGTSKVRDVKNHLETLVEPLQRRYMYGPSNRPDSPAEVKTFLDAVGEFMYCTETLLSPDRTRLFAEIEAQWSILNTESRSRLLETGGKWLDGLEVRELASAVAMVTESAYKRWHDRGSSFQDELQRYPGGLEQAYSSEDFDFRYFFRWAAECQDFLSAVDELITKSAAAAGALGSA